MPRPGCSSVLGEKKKEKKEICCWYGSLYAIPWQSDKCKCLCEQHKLFPLLKNVWLGSRFCSLKHFISFSLTLYCGKISCAIIGGIILVISFFPKKVSLTSCTGLCKTAGTQMRQKAPPSTTDLQYTTLWFDWLMAGSLLYILLMAILHECIFSH